MQTASEFFYHKAGWGYHPDCESEIVGRLLGADALARAESWARQSGAVFAWEEDPEMAEVFNENTDAYDLLPAVCCFMYLPCAECPNGVLDLGACPHKRYVHIAASLHAITESDDWRERLDYRRVVEAELALEVMPS